MSLYPSLEDMKVDQMGRAQVQISQQIASQIANVSEASAPSAQYAHPPYPLHPPQAEDKSSLAHLYPALGDYMGLEFTHEIIAANMPEYLLPTSTPELGTVAIPASSSMSSVMPAGIVAPISGASTGLQKAQVTNAIREVTVCKDGDGKIGMRVKAINKGVFVCLVKKNSPAALAGLRFGDQILQISDVTVAGYSMEKVHDILKKCPTNGIRFAIRDR
ncbi:hypothetical protein SK128_024305 [Halocaridina rubra]|uniref:PDZ domain-containing protein n=1 Tax=Halocaridina rubra TaxID=373956 RepID=A0AAN8XRY3_HALRR